MISWFLLKKFLKNKLIIYCLLIKISYYRLTDTDGRNSSWCGYHHLERSYFKNMYSTIPRKESYASYRGVI